MGLAPGNAKITAGQALYKGQDLLVLDEQRMEHIRGAEIAMIFQEPMTALNPVMRVGEQIGAPVRKHLGLSRSAARQHAIDQLALVGIPDPGIRVDALPHELSGGMRQRVMIAMALASSPKLLIADEPTTALDVTIQAQILELLNRLRMELGLAILIITHDFGVIAELAERVAVMYGGLIVEEAAVDTVFDAPRHPYSRGLQDATPDIDMPLERRLHTIGGTVPHLSELPAGCAYHPRCPLAMPICSKESPRMIRSECGGRVACWACEV